MICYECKSTIGYEDDGSDKAHAKCEVEEYYHVFCPDCVNNKAGLFECRECGINTCTWCAHIMEDCEKVLVCPECCEKL